METHHGHSKTEEGSDCCQPSHPKAATSRTHSRWRGRVLRHGCREMSHKRLITVAVCCATRGGSAENRRDTEFRDRKPRKHVALRHKSRNGQILITRH